MLSISKESSETITFLKCFLALGVVMIHARFTEVIIGGQNLLANGDFGVYLSFMEFIKVFLRVCVPVYFMISGFLFFLKIPENPNYFFFLDKYKSRITSLLIPYLIGNLLIIVLLFLAERYLGGFMSGANRSISEYSFFDFLRSFWAQPQYGAPINEVLWFIRELMVMVLLSPIIYRLIKKIGVWCLVLFLLNYLLDFTKPIPGLRPVAIYFFSLGAFFSIKGKDMVSLLCKYSLAFIIIYLIFLIIALYTDIDLLKKLSVVTGAPVIITLASYYVSHKKLHVDKKWITATFFLYIYHDLPDIALKKAMIKFIEPTSSIGCFFTYFTTIVVVTIVMLLLYFILQKLMPRVMAVVVGGR